MLDKWCNGWNINKCEYAAFRLISNLLLILSIWARPHRCIARSLASRILQLDVHKRQVANLDDAHNQEQQERQDQGKFDQALTRTAA